MEISNRRNLLRLLGAGAAVGLIASTNAYGATSSGSSLSRIYDVTAYGATGNGSTDDGAAVNAAIAALVTAGEGVLYFPAGTYLMTSQLALSNFSGGIIGDGVGQSVLKFSGSNGINIDNSGTASLMHRPFVRIENLTISTVDNGLYVGLTYKGASTTALGKQFTVRECQFCGVTNGAAWNTALLASQAAMSEFLGLHFIGNTSDKSRMSAGLHIIDNSTDIKIYGCSVYWSDIAFLIEGVSTNPLTAGESIFVDKCIMAAINYGVWVRNSVGNHICVTGNHIDTSTAGVIIGTSGTNGCNFSQINNNLIFKTAGSTSYYNGITIYSSYCTVMSNDLFRGSNASSSGNGIVIGNNASLCRIISNNLYQIGGTGIWLDASTNNNIVENNIWTIPTSSIYDQGVNNHVTNNYSA